MTGITVEGRLFLQRLKKEEKEEGLWHKSRLVAGVLLGYIVGLLSPLFTEWLKKTFLG
jgi:H+/Cl- antiporter ClcA